MTSNRLFLTVSAVLISLLGEAQIERLVADKDLTGATICAMMVDAITGEEIESYNKEVLACPASVWKLATTSAALAELGRDFRFNTHLAYTGEIKDSVLYGDIVIVGSGDPSLGSRYFNGGFDELLSTCAQFVVAVGIDSITGNVIGNGAHFQGQNIPGTHVWEDMGNYFGAGIHGLNFNDNTYFLNFSTPNQEGLLAKLLSVYPEVPGLDIESEVLSSTIQSDQAYIYGSPLDMKRTVRGTLPLGQDRYTIKGSIPDPALFMAFHLRESLTKAGVPSKGYTAERELLREPITCTKLATTESIPLSEMVKHINKQSDNLMADGLLVQLGAKKGDPSIEGGLKALEEYLKKIWGQEATFFAYDGSGLSRFTAVSAEQLAQLLVSMRNSDVQKKYLLEVLPEAGKEGSVKWFGLRTNLSGNTKLKSGSMKNVKAYAGVLQTYSGRELAFVIMVNNFEISGTEVRKKIEEWLIRAYGQY
ncbi:MAG: D-alanyl-D-alanine carboxypeptidase/D-alanyl-D-alanine-endopeptidase (penicillin-binding protein 4) [Cryomorphaceae bacterium]|jgi:D-alanyl-D-alanine carboxypeptidase/D-alanyl-D-alanine-endopeptidase (penicillin-binding protein 4)